MKKIKPTRRATRNVAKGLGLFSFALGIAEVYAPGTISRLFRMPEKKTAIHAYGIREMATGAGILMSRKPAPWLWARVGGDGLDIYTLAKGLLRTKKGRRNTALALAAVAGITAIDVYCARCLKGKSPSKGAVYNYSDRSGFPASPRAMRGIARGFQVPADMRAPEIQPYKALSPPPQAGSRKDSGKQESRLLS